MIYIATKDLEIDEDFIIAISKYLHIACGFSDNFRHKKASRTNNTLWYFISECRLGAVE